VGGGACHLFISEKPFENRKTNLAMDILQLEIFKN